jgi:hypothetical protein
MWVPYGANRATLLVRRADGRLTLQGIDARVARAMRLAADFLHAHPASSLGRQLAQDESVFGRDLSVALESA